MADSLYIKIIECVASPLHVDTIQDKKFTLVLWFDHEDNYLDPLLTVAIATAGVNLRN